VRWQDLKDLFRKAGTVLRADVSLGPDNRSRGYGTVLLASAEDAGRAVDMFNGYSWQTRILEVRPDRLPPDFDNPSSAGFTSGVPNLQNSLGATPFAPTGQNNSSVSAAILTNAAGEDFDYTLFHLYDELGPSGAGGRNLFVGNVSFYLCPRVCVSLSNPATISLSVAGSEGSLSAGRDYHSCRCCIGPRRSFERFWNRSFRH
jgi:RNA recognition motif-containing protein